MSTAWSHIAGEIAFLSAKNEGAPLEAHEWRKLQESLLGWG